MMDNIVERSAISLRKEADRDFFDMSLISEPLHLYYGIKCSQQILLTSLKIVKRLMQLDVYPGDYTLEDLESGRGFQFRTGTPTELLSWIESEWMTRGHSPTLEDPICWFALKRS